VRFCVSAYGHMGVTTSLTSEGKWRRKRLVSAQNKQTTQTKNYFSRLLRPLHSTQEILPREDATQPRRFLPLSYTPSVLRICISSPVKNPLLLQSHTSASRLSSIDSLTDQILLAFIFTPFVSGPVVTLRGSFGGNSLFGRRPWPSGGVNSVWLGISAEIGVPGSCFPQFYHSFWAKRDIFPFDEKVEFL
jgi:hypothetical protein